MVTAEFAMAIPALVLVTVMLTWLLSLAVSHGQVSQAVREGARAAARGESAGQVRAVVRGLAPGASVSVRRVGEQVVVGASLLRTPPMRVLRPLGREIRASSTSWLEQP